MSAVDIKCEYLCDESQLNICAMNTLILDPNHYYQIEGSQILIHAFQIPVKGRVVFSAAHTNFFKNQNWSIRMWISEVPRGESFTYEPNPVLSYVAPLKNPVKFGLFDIELGKVDADTDVIWLKPGASSVTYYLNIQNMEVRPNAFYLKIDEITD